MQALLEVSRVVLGMFVTLFAPGYSFQAALFPRASDLEAKERLALSFVLSVAVSSPMVLILDKIPGGLGAWPVAIAFIGFISSCMGIAAYRRRHLAESERVAIHFAPAIRTWWRGRPQAGKWRHWARRHWARRHWARRYWVVGLILSMALAGLVVMTSSPMPGEGYSEFYLLGTQGLAEDYAREAIVGQPVTTTFGITNREREETVYRVAVYQEEARIGEAGPYRLEEGEVLEARLTFTPVRAGEDVRVRFYLFKNEGNRPYRLLELWVKVKAQG